MRIPDAPPRYDSDEQTRVRRSLELELDRKLENQREMQPQRFILVAANGNRYLLGVGNTGTLTTTLL
jgi:hypothetical protein